MKQAKFKSMLVFILLIGALFAPAVSAKNVGGKKLKIVSLGDSITFGLNLDTDRSKPSDYAFPNLIGERDHKVTNLSQSGWTSSQLLAEMERDPAFGDAIRKADVITLNIGSNDLLQATGIAALARSGQPIFITSELIQKIEIETAKLAINMNSILANIRAKTDAPVILYTLYNPFGYTGIPLFDSFYVAGNTLLGPVNQKVILPQAKADSSILIADSFEAFNGKQAEYILPGDIHPTIKGQEVLAKLAEEQIVKMDDKRIKLKESK
ncbi:SGNH/GDSL hydrolase family protein [Bacillus sp. FJAT-27445]|uniref:SGNH/GDSL hydrolase family protein n=1 Tax=Bacillus sp. FJAT-27445 TaxID=1679166 RepID=UPI0007438399|nr:SGNH/GDSL hydrolase family protein [Bacillus sp. FJAT-27445]